MPYFAQFGSSAPVVLAAKLAITNVFTSTPIDPVGGYVVGEVITGEIVIENIGNADALNVSLANTLSPMVLVLDPDGLLNGGTTTIAVGATYTIAYSRTVTLDDTGRAVVENVATASATDVVDASATATETNLVPWLVGDDFNNGTVVTGVSVQTQMLWTAFGNLDILGTGNGFTKLGGAGGVIGPIISLTPNMNELTVAYDIGKIGTLEVGDTYGVEYTLDGGATWLTIVDHSGSGSEVGTFDITVTGASTLQLRYLVSNNDSGGADGGSGEAMKLYDLSIEVKS